MTLYIISICVLIVFIVLAYFIVKYKNNKLTTMSFRETMDLVGLPIVTFRNDNNKVNFLLDTGASDSVINKSVLPLVKHEVINSKGQIYGMEGNTVDCNIAYIELSYKDCLYSDNFRVIDMDNAFKQLKQDYGVTIHGILSSSFFEKYKYILNFKDLIAYSKR